jgi:acyl-[acyl carrier protein]--UDP-N-acetylglucosamine O-acyltransferase
MSSQERLELKTLYHALFRSGKNLRAAIADAEKRFGGEPAKAMISFISLSKRGVCRDTGAVGSDS